MPDGEQGHYPYQAPIDAYGDGGFRFAEMSHRGSLLCLPTGMHAWDVTSPDEISMETLDPVFQVADQIEVLFVGLGSDIRPFPADLREAFRARSVIVEAVGTGGAISTYNIMLSENRAVAAALIAVERPSRVRR